MRIVCISDTHNRAESVSIPYGDILIHAGDLTMSGSINAMRDAASWLKRLPHTYKVIIAGNHDWCLYKKAQLWGAERLFDQPGMHYLRDSSCQIEHLKIWGSPWQPEFYNWAFNLPRKGPDLRDIWDRIPNDTNILVTHGPPMGILDKAPDIYTGEETSVGCELLADRVSNIPLDLHVFGHIHEGYGQVKRGSTTYVNASTCTRNYKPTNPPIVVDL